MATARYFDESKYDGSHPYGGVPLADISDEEWEALPKHVQASTDALAYFRKTKPTPERPARQEEVSTDG